MLTWMHVQTQTFSIEIQLVLATGFLYYSGNISGILNLSEIDVTSALLDSLSDTLGGSGLTLSADASSLLLLSGSVADESRSSSFLLSVRSQAAVPGTERW